MTGLAWLAMVLWIYGVAPWLCGAGLVLALGLHRLLNPQTPGLLIRQVDGCWRVPGRAGRWQLRAARLLPFGLLRLDFHAVHGRGRHALFVAEDAVGALPHWRLRVSLLQPDLS